MTSLLLLLLAVARLSPDAVAQSKEYSLKAAFLYNFTQFVDWPAEAFARPDAPITIGVLGADPFGATLDELVQNETVKGRKLEVRRYQNVDEIGGCHILFISQSENQQLESILAALKARNILTVGEAEDFVLRGGAISLLTGQNRIRLKINLASTNAAGLTVSSKLLRAAEVVGRPKN